jgi:hypothetical protein
MAVIERVKNIEIKLADPLIPERVKNIEIKLADPLIPLLDSLISGEIIKYSLKVA